MHTYLDGEPGSRHEECAVVDEEPREDQEIRSKYGRQQWLKTRVCDLSSYQSSEPVGHGQRGEEGAGVDEGAEGRWQAWKVLEDGCADLRWGGNPSSCMQLLAYG